MSAIGLHARRGGRVRGLMRSLGAAALVLACAACFKPTGLQGTTEDTSSGSETGGSTDGGTTSATATTPTSEGPTSVTTSTSEGPTTLSTTEDVSTTVETTTESVTTATTTMPGTTLPGTSGSESSTTGAGFCGDSVLDPGEACDDGNNRDGDGCQHDCMLPGCGDGILDGGEACDDGNLVDKDGCSSACVRDAAFVFVSSALYPSNLDGPAGADAKCQALASAAGLPGTYQAWISVDIMPAIEHLKPLPLPYIRTDKVLVADSFAAILDPGPKKLKAPILVTELGESLTMMRAACDSGPPVWTGTDEGGLAIPAGNCNGWKQLAAIDAAGVGKASATDLTWTRGCGLKCSATAHLYCFEALMK